MPSLPEELAAALPQICAAPSEALHKQQYAALIDPVHLFHTAAIPPLTAPDTGLPTEPLY
jgi:hypothetical protein